MYRFLLGVFIILAIWFGFLFKNKEPEIIRHKSYIVSYDVSKKNPKWVCWEIGKTNIYKRDGLFFTEDPKIKTASSSSFRHSGYDLGHICPAADMSFDKTSIRESFFMSNISPQNPNLNRGEWKILEENLRKEAKLTNIYCVAGTWWYTNKFTIGDGVRVPDGFWKIAFGGTGETTRAWYFPNEECKKRFDGYRTDFETLHLSTGIDFHKCTNLLLRVR